MKNNRKHSILELLEKHYNTKEGKESKFSWYHLHETAQELLTEDNELTDEAQLEAKQNSFDADAYKQILIYLAHNSYIGFETQISQLYERGKFDLEKLLEDKNINRLALAYKDHKGSIPIEKLILLNPALQLEGFQSKTTFVHKLFEINAAKEDILYFFGRLHSLSWKNPDLIQNYLLLSDENEKSITAILQERSLDGKYWNIFSDIKTLYSRLYESQNNINNTGSVDESADKSLVNNLFSENVANELIPKPILNQVNEFKGESAECTSAHEPETDPQNSFASFKMGNGITHNNFDPFRVHNFAFDEEAGYVLALESLYNINKKVFINTLDRELSDAITSKNLHSARARKINCIINLLFASRNEGMKAAVQEVFQEHLKGFSQDQKDQYFILMAEADNGYMLMPLIQSGANVHVRDSRAGHALNNALMYSALNNNIEAITALIHCGAKINDKDTRENTALHSASEASNIEAITTLIKLGAKINSINSYASTALHIAVLKRNAEAIQVLINLGANINAVMNNGNTPLHMAALDNNIDAVRTLIESGADINIKNNYQNTALDIARNNNKTESANILKYYLSLPVCLKTGSTDNNLAIIKSTFYMRHLGYNIIPKWVESIMSKPFQNPFIKPMNEMLKQFKEKQKIELYYPKKNDTHVKRLEEKQVSSNDIEIAFP